MSNVYVSSACCVYTTLIFGLYIFEEQSKSGFQFTLIRTYLIQTPRGGSLKYIYLKRSVIRYKILDVYYTIHTPITSMYYAMFPLASPRTE